MKLLFLDLQVARKDYLVNSSLAVKFYIMYLKLSSTCVMIQYLECHGNLYKTGTTWISHACSLLFYLPKIPDNCARIKHVDGIAFPCSPSWKLAKIVILQVICSVFSPTIDCFLILIWKTIKQFLIKVHFECTYMQRQI